MDSCNALFNDRFKITVRRQRDACFFLVRFLFAKNSFNNLFELCKIKFEEIETHGTYSYFIFKSTFISCHYLRLKYPRKLLIASYFHIWLWYECIEFAFSSIEFISYSFTLRVHLIVKGNLLTRLTLNRKFLKTYFSKRLSCRAT